MALEDFQSKTDEQQDSTDDSDDDPLGDEVHGAVLESIVSDALDNLAEVEDNDLHFEDGKVVCDKQELTEHIMMMCALSVDEIAN